MLLKSSIAFARSVRWLYSNGGSRIALLSQQKDLSPGSEHAAKPCDGLFTVFLLPEGTQSKCHVKCFKLNGSNLLSCLCVKRYHVRHMKQTATWRYIVSVLIVDCCEPHITCVRVQTVNAFFRRYGFK